MQIFKIENGWLASPGDGNISRMFYYKTLGEIDALLSTSVVAAAAASKAAAPDVGNIPGDAPALATPVAAAPVADIAAERKKRGRPQKQAAPKISAGVLPPPAPVGPPTLEQARAALNELNATRGLQACRDAMAKVNAQRISDVKPERYADFIALCKKGMEAGGA